MKNLISYLLVFSGGILLLCGCRTSARADAYGNFEAREWTIPAGGSGRILSFLAEEGQTLRKDQIAGYIDTTRLSLEKRQIDAQIKALLATLPNAPVQLNVVKQKKKALEREEERIGNLVRAGAIDQKKLDQIQDELNVIDREIAAATSSLSRESAGILAQIEPLEIQREIIEDQISRNLITNPEEGVVLTKFAEIHEYVATGTPLYTLANLEEMTMNAWFPGEFLSELHPGDKVTVSIDIPGESMKKYTGEITTISENPEFTPNQVQTRETRTHMLYEVQIRVKNDGAIKPGMPGEVTLSEE